MDLALKANCINTLSDFCGMRDVKDLNSEELESKFSIKQADVMVLFGGSILEGGNVLARAILNKVARKYIIVGGAGHTTETLRQVANSIVPQIETADFTEAEIFAEYLLYKYKLKADYLECESTNCGNNITNLLELLEKNNVVCKSIILSQDATMQFRMCAGLQKYRPGITAINFAAYRTRVMLNNGQLLFEDKPMGMWDMERYISLLMGEIPRLTDDQNGYGPKGKGFIAHVDIPDNVKRAFLLLQESNRELIREMVQ